MQIAALIQIKHLIQLPYSSRLQKGVQAVISVVKSLRHCLPAGSISLTPCPTGPHTTQSQSLTDNTDKQITRRKTPLNERKPPPHTYSSNSGTMSSSTRPRLAVIRRPRSTQCSLNGLSTDSRKLLRGGEKGSLAEQHERILAKEFRGWTAKCDGAAEA